jgi:hypothetical protein
MNKTTYFKKEIDLIKGEDAKKFVKLVIKEFPTYFFNDCPVSSSGKYHPPALRKGDGTRLHTKLVARLVHVYCDMLRFGPELTDAYIIAALCHDALKQGNYATGHTVKEHPKLAAYMIKEVHEKNKNLLTDRQFDVIFFNCLYHYGRWGNPNGHPFEVGLKYSLLHIADLTASRLHNVTDGILKLK